MQRSKDFCTLSYTHYRLQGESETTSQSSRDFPPSRSQGHPGLQPGKGRVEGRYQIGLGKAWILMTCTYEVRLGDEVRVLHPRRVDPDLSTDNFLSGYFVRKTVVKDVFV